MDNLMNLIIETLLNNEYEIQEIETVKALQKRKNNISFSFEDHISGMVYALLSNQRPWKAISDNYDKIKEIFHNFDPVYLQEIDPLVLTNSIREIKCGNRSIKSQMNSLSYNIDVFKNITSTYKTMDNYVTSDEPLIIANELSQGKYKLKQMGIALVIEYLKNVGIDAFKPDVHIKRLFGSNRLGLSNKELATEQEVINLAKEISIKSGIPITIIDSIIWQFCATNYAEICSSSPQCEKCLVRTKCNYNK